MFYMYFINEGGGFGHLMHIYEDYSLTFNDIKNIFQNIIDYINEEETTIELYEKVDGINIGITYKNNDIKFIRNKTNIMNYAENAYTLNEIKEKFNEKIYLKNINIAIDDIYNAFINLDEDLLNNIFQNGKNILYIEIIDANNYNLINYNNYFLIPLQIIKYDKNANPIKNDKQKIEIISNIIEDLNKNNKKYEFKSLNKIFFINKDTLIEKLNIILNDYLNYLNENNITLNTTLGKYLEEKIYNFIKNKFKIEEEKIIPLIYKILYNEKLNFRMNNTERELVENSSEIINSYLFQIEKYITLFGIYILKNIGNSIFVIDKNNSEIKKFINNINDIIDNYETYFLKKDISEKNKKRILDAIKKLKQYNINNFVGIEGVVFEYKNKLYKLTGLFKYLNVINFIINK